METNEVKQMTLQHTPLPWKCGGVTLVKGEHYTIARVMGWNEIISESGWDVGYEMTSANAAFIVEACNNYYSLRSLVEELKKENERLKVTNAWQLCPKCHGQGMVSKPPGIPADIEWSSSSSQISWVCDVCEGSKLLLQPK